MCGISFYCSRKSSFPRRLERSLESIRHRGPDASGVFEAQLSGAYVGLGHNRLSIIELSEAGKQPMHNPEGVSLIFNGEIYNHDVLRKSLKDKGYLFKGNSDTEVILNLYAEYGIKSFAMLQGMFAIAILDSVSEKLHVIRDVLGIKPIYLSVNKDGMFGCSELKGLKDLLECNLEVDEDDVYEFFNNGFLYEPSTGFKGIKKVLPGELITLELSTGKVKKQQLMSLNHYTNNDDLETKLRVAINSQMVADVPVGIFFSGGADSSILATYSSDADLFFAQFASDASSDIDQKYSKLIANHLERKMVSHKFDDSELNVEDLIEQVKFVAKHTEELISDYTFFATYQLSKAARDNGYKVMLSGMGGDEVFAGYPRYHVLQNHKLIMLVKPVFKIMLRHRLYPKSLDKKIARLVSYGSEKNWPVAYSRLLGYFSRDELNNLFVSNEEKLYQHYSSKVQSVLNKFNGDINDKVKAGQYMDSLGFLSHNLMVSDKASMLASIELRVPLLNEALVAHGVLTGSSQLIDSKSTKKPLRSILKNCLPKKLIERPKTGFNPPLDTLIERLGKQRLRNELSSIDKFISSDFAVSLVDSHFSGKENNAYKIWQLLYFKYWLEKQASSI